MDRVSWIASRVWAGIFNGLKETRFFPPFEYRGELTLAQWKHHLASRRCRSAGLELSYKIDAKWEVLLAQACASSNFVWMRNGSTTEDSGKNTQLDLSKPVSAGNSDRLLFLWIYTVGAAFNGK
jgi:hypothetical protein